MANNNQKVILVDSCDREIGVEEKIKAHIDGKLHRAFSIFIFNKRGELLLQKRAMSKYHCPSLWTNTCCGHPSPGEATLHAARRRLMEEMGIDSEIIEIFSFTYRVELKNGLIEHEYDHVFCGNFDGEAKPNPEEAGDYKWISKAKLTKEIAKKPDEFTPWFLLCYMQAFSYLPH